MRNEYMSIQCRYCTKQGLAARGISVFLPSSLYPNHPSHPKHPSSKAESRKPSAGEPFIHSYQSLSLIPNLSHGPLNTHPFPSNTSLLRDTSHCSAHYCCAAPWARACRLGVFGVSPASCPASSPWNCPSRSGYVWRRAKSRGRWPTSGCWRVWKAFWMVRWVIWVVVAKRVGLLERPLLLAMEEVVVVVVVRKPFVYGRRLIDRFDRFAGPAGLLRWCRKMTWR